MQRGGIASRARKQRQSDRAAMTSGATGQVKSGLRMSIACATWGHLVTARAALVGRWGVEAEPAVW